MALLLDTQVIIWIEENPQKISVAAKEKIFSEPEIYFSKASVWEMAIKIKTEKLVLKQFLSAFIKNFQNDYHFEILDILLSHIYQTQELALHHRDPFDRLIIAQAIAENIPIVSSDSVFDAYPVKRIW
jgi:PIN domain nuclease of toxin-antitoxin system